MISTMPGEFEYKADAASVAEALSTLMVRLKSVDKDDMEAIINAIWHTCAELDVAQDALENALALSSPVFVAK